MVQNMEYQLKINKKLPKKKTIKEIENFLNINHDIIQSSLLVSFNMKDLQLLQHIYKGSKKNQNFTKARVRQKMSNYKKIKVNCNLMRDQHNSMLISEAVESNFSKSVAMWFLENLFKQIFMCMFMKTSGSWLL